jgi:hypothetical protein
VEADITMMGNMEAKPGTVLLRLPTTTRSSWGSCRYAS